MTREYLTMKGEEEPEKPSTTSTPETPTRAQIGTRDALLIVTPSLVHRSLLATMITTTTSELLTPLVLVIPTTTPLESQTLLVPMIELMIGTIAPACPAPLLRPRRFASKSQLGRRKIVS